MDNQTPRAIQSLEESTVNHSNEVEGVNEASPPREEPTRSAKIGQFGQKVRQYFELRRQRAVTARQSALVKGAPSLQKLSSAELELLAQQQLRAERINNWISWSMLPLAFFFLYKITDSTWLYNIDSPALFTVALIGTMTLPWVFALVITSWIRNRFHRVSLADLNTSLTAALVLCDLEPGITQDIKVRRQLKAQIEECAKGVERKVAKSLGVSPRKVQDRPILERLYQIAESMRNLKYTVAFADSRTRDDLRGQILGLLSALLTLRLHELPHDDSKHIEDMSRPRRLRFALPAGVVTPIGEALGKVLIYAIVVLAVLVATKKQGESMDWSKLLDILK